MSEKNQAVSAGRVLGALRHQLDGIDREILDLLARRMNICMDIARLKADNDIPMMQMDRVNLVVDRARAKAAANRLPEDYFEDLYRRIIVETCAQEDALITQLRGEVVS